jgi:8-oxo-dGTP diphosphatase
MRYTCGFLIAAGHVLLVDKLNPPWQSGYLNGIGGKVEGDESLHAAQAREFMEETGIDVPGHYWDWFAVEKSQNAEVHFFRCIWQVQKVPEVIKKGHLNDVGEPVAWWDIGGLRERPVIGNLNWLIPMAQDWRDIQVHINVTDDISKRATW